MSYRQACRQWVAALMLVGLSTFAACDRRQPLSQVEVTTGSTGVEVGRNLHYVILIPDQRLRPGVETLFVRYGGRSAEGVVVEAGNRVTAVMGRPVDLEELQKRSAIYTVSSSGEIVRLPVAEENVHDVISLVRSSSHGELRDSLQWREQVDDVLLREAVGEE